MIYFLDLFFRSWVFIVAWIYGGEGINIPLRTMPTRFIAPTFRRYGAQIGERVRFLAPLVIHNSGLTAPFYYKNLSVGNDCYFGRELFLDLQDQVIIGDHVTMSHRVMIMTHTDAGTSPLKDTVIKTSHKAVNIHHGVYIGANVTILEGVEIGKESIVGAGALVNKSMPAQVTIFGVPAKVAKRLHSKN